MFWAANLDDVHQALRQLSLPYFICALALILIGFFTRIWRWSYIVRATKPEATFRHMFSATQIGYLVNFVLPARLGEVVRAIVLGRLEKLPLSKCIASVALDRVTDLLALLVTTAIALIAFTPQSDIVIPASILQASRDITVSSDLLISGARTCFIVAIAVLGLLLFVYRYQSLLLRLIEAGPGRFSKKAATWIRDRVQLFTEGLSIFRSMKDVAMSIFFSLLTWASFIFSAMFFARAFAIAWPWYTPFVMLTCVSILISLPGAPGFIGQYHLAVIAALKMVMPTISFADALAFATVMHLSTAVLTILVGVFCVYWEGFGLIDLVRDARTSKRSP